MMWKVRNPWAFRIVSLALLLRPSTTQGRGFSQLEHCLLYGGIQPGDDLSLDQERPTMRSGTGGAAMVPPDGR
jgi:hypothetical protein